MSRRFGVPLALALALALGGCTHTADKALASLLPAPNKQNAGFFIILGAVILTCYGISEATN